MAASQHPRCRCPDGHCDEPGEAALDGLCEFCFALCPAPSRRTFEEAFLGLRRWRTHLLKRWVEAEGHVAREVVPLVILLGSLARAEAWRAELAEMDAAFVRACARDEAG